VGVHVKDIVRKFKMEDSKAMAAPMSTTTSLDADKEGEHAALRTNSYFYASTIHEKGPKK
jgi:uncharacterized protein YifN (PemK superfamily)